jgi:hypothetical protein
VVCLEGNPGSAEDMNPILLNTGVGTRINEYWLHCLRMAILSIVALGLPFLPLFKVVSNPDNIRYLLSSIAQGMATIFALVVTVPMLYFSMMQIAGRSTKTKAAHFIRLELRPLQVISYLLLIVTIIFPLYCLAFNWYHWFMVKFNLGLALFGLYIVFETAFAFKRKLELTNKYDSLRDTD